MKQRGIRIGELLVLEGFLTKAQLDVALGIQKETGEFLGQTLIKNKMVTEVQIATVLSRQFEMPYCELNFDEIDWAVAAHFSGLMNGQLCFPFEQDSDSVMVAIANPLDALAVSQIEAGVRGRTVQLALSTETAIKKAIHEFRRRSLS